MEIEELMTDKQTERQAEFPLVDSTPSVKGSSENTDFCRLFISAFLLDPFYRRGRVYKRKICVSVCLSVRLSVITFSFFEY